MIESDKYKNKKFKVKGNGNYSYSENTGKVYESYIPNRIYLERDDAETYSKATMNLLFKSESLDDMSVEEKGRYYVNGWIMERDNNRKANIPVPTTIVIPSNIVNSKGVNISSNWVKKFRVDDESIKEYGVEINMLNGAQKMEITEDMLTDEQKEDLEMELITMDDIRAELGRSTYGDRVHEYQFVNPAKGFKTKGAQTTAYTLEDMEIKSIVEDAVEDLFDDDDDI